MTSADHLSDDFLRDFDLSDDFLRDFVNFTGYQKQQNVYNLYKKAPVLFTIVRNDGQRCFALPCKWLSTFVCFDFCQDGVEVYAGSTPNDPDESNLGRPYQLDPNRKIGAVTQPNFGGGFRPELHLQEGGDVAFGKKVLN